MIFVDSNIAMYLVGRPHPNRDTAAEFLRGQSDEVFVTSAEVYQECVHRYIAIDRRAAITDCFALLNDLVDHVYPITREDVVEAARISRHQRRLSGRDCLHLAVMERHGIDRIFSFDRGFELWPGIRLVPG